MALVGEAVELGADLADLGHHQLLVGAALVGRLVQEGALDVHIEAARAEERHLVVEHVGQLDHLAGLDQAGGLDDGGRLLMVAGAALVAGTPLRWAAVPLRGRRPARRLLGQHRRLTAAAAARPSVMV